MDVVTDVYDGHMTTTRFITFGLGGPAAGLFTKVEVEDGHPDSPEIAARTATVQAYGTAWAFDYSAESFAGQPEKYGLKQRETIRVSADCTAKIVPA